MIRANKTKEIKIARFALLYPHPFITADLTTNNRTRNERESNPLLMTCVLIPNFLLLFLYIAQTKHTNTANANPRLKLHITGVAFEVVTSIGPVVCAAVLFQVPVLLPNTDSSALKLVLVGDVDSQLSTPVLLAHVESQLPTPVLLVHEDFQSSNSVLLAHVDSQVPSGVAVVPPNTPTGVVCQAVAVVKMLLRLYTVSSMLTALST